LAQHGVKNPWWIFLSDPLKARATLICLPRVPLLVGEYFSRAFYHKGLSFTVVYSSRSLLVWSKVQSGESPKWSLLSSASYWGCHSARVNLGFTSFFITLIYCPDCVEAVLEDSNHSFGISNTAGHAILLTATKGRLGEILGGTIVSFNDGNASKRSFSECFSYEYHVKKTLLLHS
jgi:hypothetical protein